MFKRSCHNDQYWFIPLN